MRRFLALALVLLICVSLISCSEKPKGEGDTKGKEEPVTLTVGMTCLEGNFIPGLGEDHYDDPWVKTLLYEFYSLYVITDVGEIVLNETVVNNLNINTDGAGNKTYTFEIHPDLKWNNGEPIKAQDYVFALLWQASKEWEAVGAKSTAGQGLLGYSDYHGGGTDHFAGVQLLDDYKFSLTIGADSTGFFETAFMTIYPLPMAAWSPEAKIDSSPDGARLISDNPQWSLGADAWHLTMRQQYSAMVSNGPFSIERFSDTETTLKANPHFKGDYLGRKPQVDYIVLHSIRTYQDVEACVRGEVDAMTGIDNGYTLEQVLDVEEVDVAYHSRNGFGGMYFHCDFGPVQHKEVRQALAYLIDRQKVIRDHYDGCGQIVNGLYSLGHWLYLDNKAAIDALPEYKLDIANANSLLDQSPYRYEADGKTPFDASKATEDSGYFRHNAQGERLVINHVEMEDGGGLIAYKPIPSQLLANAPLAGIDWKLHELDFVTALEHMYDGPKLPKGERRYHSFPLSVNLSAVFDPYLQYHSDGPDNIVRISDPELDDITLKMRQLEPHQKEQFSAEWVKFQTRWNQVLPIAPLASNIYYDVFRREVKGFYTTPFTSWAHNVCGITKEEKAPRKADSPPTSFYRAPARFFFSSLPYHYWLTDHDF
ncbi:MAG TPA: ABC transporter substrate-binding protein [Bacillota bacterium]|nr:ABC transporter substrate-binding protein [Bacillota bacterium]